MDKREEIFPAGARVIIDVNDKKYKGAVVDCAGKDSLRIKVFKPDINLIRILSNTLCNVSIVPGDDYLYAFKTTIINKKIPLISLKYPERIDAIPLKKLQKVKTSIWCSILVEKKERQQVILKEAGDGTIVELNLIGCRLMTHYRAKTGDSILLSILHTDDNDIPLKCKGTVKSLSPAPYDATYYVIDFEDMEQESKKKLEEIVNSPDA